MYVAKLEDMSGEVCDKQQAVSNECSVDIFFCGIACAICGRVLTVYGERSFTLMAAFGFYPVLPPQQCDVANVSVFDYLANIGPPSGDGGKVYF